jgi:hypothetical protein
MKRIVPTTPAPPDRTCSMCGGTAAYRGLFAGNMEGFGCTDRGCGHTFLTRRQESDKVEA